MTNVEARGNNTLERAMIRNVTLIEAIGSNVLSSSTIISENNDELTVLVDGINEEEYSIYCNVSDICYIGCLSHGSCSNLTLYCFGTCKVFCDDDSVWNGIQCPIAIIGNFADWPMTTMPPSFLPSTMIPTAMPSNATNASEFKR